MLKLAVIFLVSAIVFPAWASIGTITMSTGTGAEVNRAGNLSVGSKDTAIESNDIVTTKNGSVNIDFVDRTKVTVTEQSRLAIDDFVFDTSKTDASKLALKVSLGTVRYASGQIAKVNSQKVDIQTPTATVAVRGTDFFMIVDEIGRSFVTLVPSCDSAGNCVTGSIDVITPGGKVTLNQAFTATAVMRIGGSPSPPVSIPADIKAINNMLIVSQPSELRKAVLKQLQGQDNGNSAMENKEENISNSTANNSDLPTETQVNKIVVNKEIDHTTAYRVTPGSGAAYVILPQNDSVQLSITQQNHTASVDLNGGSGSKITIKQSK